MIGIDWLSSVLYPGEGGFDLRATARDFYSLFYHVNVTDAQLDSLLAGAALAP